MAAASFLPSAGAKSRGTMLRASDCKLSDAKTSEGRSGLSLDPADCGGDVDDDDVH